jgi:hypothetical protein
LASVRRSGVAIGVTIRRGLSRTGTDNSIECVSQSPPRVSARRVSRTP